MLVFQIKRIISSEKWFNYVVTLFFFFKNAKNLGWSDDAKRRKKRGWPCICLETMRKFLCGISTFRCVFVDTQMEIIISRLTALEWT